MKPICVKCRLFYNPKKNGVPFLEGMPTQEGGWKPYKLWMADLWECRGCETQIIIEAGREPLSEHYYDDFKTTVKRLNPLLQVDDC